MLKSKFLTITSLAVSLSLLAAMPVFAGNGQINQNGMNMQFMQNGQVQNVQNGQVQNVQNGQMQNMQNNLSQGVQTRQQLSNAAQFMIGKGIIKGNSGGDYAMSDNVKRCDMSLMVVRAFNLDTGSGSGSGNFSDVVQGSYYYDAVNAMKQLGIAQGDGQNFRPAAYMTLQEAILFVQRSLDAAGIDYSDADFDDLFEGRSLSDNATREDVSVILYAVLGEDYSAAVVNQASVIEYETDENDAVTFDSGDFNDVCEDTTDETLDYVIFTNPSVSLGRLYYDYTSSSDYDAKVSASDKYYYDEDDGDALSDVTFVPDENVSGTASVSYTGYDNDGNSFRGTVKITINAEEEAVADTITYETDEDTEVTFDGDDFNDVCDDATDETLNYIKFTLPSSSYGKLYYGYDSEDDYDGKVTSSGKYYYDEDDGTAISDVAFVPKNDYTGTVKIKYTGINADGETFTGTIKVTVE